MADLTPSELKDQIEFLKANPVWQMFYGLMQRIYQDSAEEALLNPDNIKVCCMAAGRAEAIRTLLKFEDTIPALVRAKKETK